MENAIRKADTLIEAMSWIKRFRDKTTVIKLGGSVLEDDDALQHILLDVCFMQTVGLRTVIVHGAGARISRAMATAGIESRFVMGRRFTDQATLEIVEKVLAVDTNNEIAQTLEKLGGRAMTLNFESTCVLTGELLRLVEGNGEESDLGLVGNVTEVDRMVIDNLCYAGQVPVIPSMCQTESGSRLNVNADSAATAVAAALGPPALQGARSELPDGARVPQRAPARDQVRAHLQQQAAAVPPGVRGAQRRRCSRATRRLCRHNSGSAHLRRTLQLEALVVQISRLERLGLSQS